MKESYDVTKLTETEFIKIQRDMIIREFSNEQIANNVYRYCVRNYLPDISLDTLITKCMFMYAEIFTNKERLKIKP